MVNHGDKFKSSIQLSGRHRSDQRCSSPYSVFCACYCYSGLLRERSFEMIGYAVAVLVIILYIIANYGVNGEEGQPIRLVSELQE